MSETTFSSSSVIYSIGRKNNLHLVFLNQSYAESLQILLPLDVSMLYFYLSLIIMLTPILTVQITFIQQHIFFNSFLQVLEYVRSIVLVHITIILIFNLDRSINTLRICRERETNNKIQKPYSIIYFIGFMKLHC